MEKPEEYYLQLLLQCMELLESSVKELDDRLADSTEINLMNNEILGFLAKTIAPVQKTSKKTQTEVNIEVWEELIRHSGDLGIWGES
jgi:hypothetical protein